MPAPQRSHPDRTPAGPPRAVADGAGSLCLFTTGGRPVQAPPLPRRRERRHVCLRYVRSVGWGHYEARWCLDRRGPLGSVTLGWFDSEHAAHRAAVEFRRRSPSIDRYPDILADLVALGVVPAGLLPKWVYPLAGGGYEARRAARSGVTHLPGPFATPADAFRAMLATLPPATPRRPSPQRKGRHWRDARSIVRRYRRGEAVDVMALEYRVNFKAIYRVLDAMGEPRRRPK